MHWWFILRLQAMKGWRSPPTFLQRAVNTKPSLTEFEPPGSWHGHLFFSQPLIYPIPFVSNTYIELTIQNTSPKIYLHKLQKKKKEKKEYIHDCTLKTFASSSSVSLNGVDDDGGKTASNALAHLP